MDYLVEHPDLDKTAVASYEEAFRATRDKLRLKKLPPLEPTTTDADFERLSADEYKTRVVIPEFQKLNQSGEPSPMDDAFWGAHPLIARSAYNARLLFEWLTAQQLKPSLANLHTAYEQIASGWGNARLVLSERAIEEMPCSEYRGYVEREFRKNHSNQTPQQSNKPLGVSWSRWINER